MSDDQQQNDVQVPMLHDWGEKGPNANFNSNMHTFKPQSNRGNKLMKLHTYAKQTLGSGNVVEAVRLPRGEDVNEWLAMHTVDFYNEITLLYAIVAQLDTEEKYPVMGAGKNKYLWADNTTVEPLKLSAPAYVKRLFEWIEKQLNDEMIFPTSLDQDFPSNFKARVSRIFRRLFRVYAHIYYAHFEYIVSQSAEAHMNSCFKHFVLFSSQFGLVDRKEMEPLKYVVDQLVGPIWDNETACSSNNDHHTSSDPSNNKRYSLKGAIEKDRRDDSPGADDGVAVATGSSKSGSASRTRVTNNNNRNAGAEDVDGGSGAGGSPQPNHNTGKCCNIL